MLNNHFEDFIRLWIQENKVQSKDNKIIGMNEIDRQECFSLFLEKYSIKVNDGVESALVEYFEELINHFYKSSFVLYDGTLDIKIYEVKNRVSSDH